MDAWQRLAMEQNATASLNVALENGYGDFLVCRPAGPSLPDAPRPAMITGTPLSSSSLRRPTSSCGTTRC